MSGAMRQKGEISIAEERRSGGVKGIEAAKWLR
jgi:hypothetical protein